MECQIQSDTRSCRTLTVQFVDEILKALEDVGVKDIALCPGSRNAFFVQKLSQENNFNVTSWYEERSAGFYALGCVKQTEAPAVVLTTSGTAAGELLSVVMEAHYLGLPLIVLTTDRPRRFRRSGAPQCAEQPGLFGHYASICEDLALGDPLNFIDDWKKKGPLHLNVCLEDPRGEMAMPKTQVPQWKMHHALDEPCIQNFFSKVQHPLAIVSGLAKQERTAVAHFLKKANIPIYLEASSGLREDPTLFPQAVRNVENLWRRAENRGYPIDGILRIGGVPTLRPWRDLDDKEGEIAVLSLTSVPFPGLFWGECAVFPLQQLDRVQIAPRTSQSSAAWLEEDQNLAQKKKGLYQRYPQAEPSLIHALSKIIPSQSLVYLGNSLPIREWDLAATIDNPHPHIACNRGLCGIDGQLSTFFGMCSPLTPNWGIFGDLTALYDMAAPWILHQKPELAPQCVIINNAGGKIFERMYPEKLFLNSHSLNFKPLAEMWGMHYCHWNNVPMDYDPQKASIIEITPDEKQTQHFWKEL